MEKLLLLNFCLGWFLKNHLESPWPCSGARQAFPGGRSPGSPDPPPVALGGARRGRRAGARGGERGRGTDLGPGAARRPAARLPLPLPAGPGHTRGALTPAPAVSSWPLPPTPARSSDKHFPTLFGGLFSNFEVRIVEDTTEGRERATKNQEGRWEGS